MKFRWMVGGILIAAVWGLWAEAGLAAQPVAPMRSRPSSLATVDSLYTWALNALNADSVRAAAERLKGAVSGYPDRAELLTRIGMLYLRVGEADSARSAFQRATAQDAGLAAAHCGLGRIYLELRDDPKRALPHFQAAVEADSAYADAHYFLALAYTKLERPEAKREASRAILLDPKYAPAYLLLARLYQQENNWQATLLYCRKYLEQNPEDQASVYAFALDLLLKGRFKEVEEITSLMTDAQGLPLLAQALMRRGDYDRAMPVFESYIDVLVPKEQELYRDISLVGLPQEVETYRATPPERREAFLRSFWLRRDPLKASGGAMRRAEHCRRVWYARTYYGQRKWPWDRRGEVYIRYGEPDYRSTWQRPNAKAPPKVQRVQDHLAYQLYGASGVGITFVGPVFPIRTNVGRYMEPPKGLEPEPDPMIQNFGPLPELFPEAKVELNPEFAIGLNNWKPMTIGNSWAAVPWEVWVYADVRKGLEVAFTDEFNSGVYDYAPVPGFTREDLERLTADRFQGESAYVRLVQRLTDLSPAGQMAKATLEAPERYDLPQFEPLDFAYDVVSFQGGNGLTDVQVNIGIPIDQVALPGEADTTVVVDRRVVLINSQYTRLLPAQQDLEAPISGRTRGQGLLDRVDLGVDPGDYELSVQVGRRNTNRLQVYQQRLSLPNYAGGELALSDPFIAKQVAAAEAASDPRFVRGRWCITPLPSHVFYVGQHVFVYFEIYNLKQDESGTTRYEVAYQVRVTGAEGTVKPPPVAKMAGRSGEAVAVRYERTGTQAWVSDYVELDVGQAEPGRYAVQMTVKDLSSGREVTKEGFFLIMNR